MIEHECMVCGALMTDGWDICVNCLAESFGGPIQDPIRDHNNRELRDRYRPEDTEDDGE